MGCEDKVAKPSCTSLYQNYLEWCGENGEKPYNSAILGKKFSLIGIDRTCSRENGVRVYQYILDHPKIVAKLRESGLGDLEEFSDIPQDDLPENETTDIPIFNVPEIIPPKIILHHSEKNTPSLSTSKNKKADKQDDSFQALFDYVATEVPVASISGTSETSKTSELSNRPETSKPPKPIEPISNMMKAPKPSSNEILSARAQREERLRKWAIDHGEDPDIFITITKKDRLDSITFRDRMETDSRMCGWAEELEEDPKEHMDMTVRERLIGEEIIRRGLEDDGITSSWLDTDEKWKKMYVAKHELSKDMNNEELSRHTPALLELLTDKLKRDKGLTPKEGGEEAGEVNICQISNIIPDGETIESIAQRIIRDNLSEKEVKAIAKALTIMSPNPVTATSCLSRLRRELQKLNALKKIISATLDEKTTCASNKIQKERRNQCENEGIDFPDHFSLESVKERLDFYDVSNTPDVQALADVMIISLERDEERAKLLLTWIQDAISSGRLRDPGVPGVKWFNTFLKKDRFLPETGKPLLPSYLHKLGAVFAVVSNSVKNLSDAMTIASQAL
ncbi:hypothetical protein C1645_835052 [Glomus cerebriforme]|uniref:Uncharacterized protein n=1 Tax=Glomus cerebriforme TaxID=658196 RepID=A0A397SF77_9GLOM|nr:hypothetical protein C1645_835052 [Glomus cerebriforme]